MFKRRVPREKVVLPLMNNLPWQQKMKASNLCLSVGDKVLLPTGQNAGNNYLTQQSCCGKQGKPIIKNERICSPA